MPEGFSVSEVVVVLDLDLGSFLRFLSKRVLESFEVVVVALAVLFLDELVVVRSEDFLEKNVLVLVEFEDFEEVELSFLTGILMVGFFPPRVEGTDTGLMSMVLLLFLVDSDGNSRSLVWFLAATEPVLMSLVWFLDELLVVALANLVWFLPLVDNKEVVAVVAELFFLIIGCSSSSCSSSILLLPKNNSFFSACTSVL